MQFALKFDLRAPSFGATPADLYAGALDMCEWADQRGFHEIRILEHHGSDDGYCPSPLIMAAAVAARTQNVRIRPRALILPLHDPVRVAEDCAVIDVISRGRLDLLVGAGYVRSEFEMFGRDLAERARRMETGIQVLKEAWTGETFTYDGRSARVAIRPHQRPRPQISMGGSSKAAARRAAALCDRFEPVAPALSDEYEAECRRLGKAPGPRLPPRPPGQFLYLAHDVERAWMELGPHLLHDTQSYAQWLSDAGADASSRTASDLDALKKSQTYLIMTPNDCVETARRLGPTGQLEFHPLVGGLDPALGWSCLRLFEQEVLPALRDQGLLTDHRRM